MLTEAECLIAANALNAEAHTFANLLDRPDLTASAKAVLTVGIQDRHELAKKLADMALVRGAFRDVPVNWEDV